MQNSFLCGIIFIINARKDKHLWTAKILKRFYVDRKYRNQKVGYLLYLELEKKIFEKELKEIYLTSGKELENAHKFYKRNGWILENNNPGIFVREGAFLYKKQYFNELQYDCM